MLIYNYEASILGYLHRCFPEIKLATYSTEEDLLTAMDNIKYYPAFFYSRDTQNWEYNKILKVTELTSKAEFVPFQQYYTGHIIVEDEKKVQEMASALRFYWNDYPYVMVPWEDKDNLLKVQLRLLYIKISSVRNPNDKKGAQRMLEFRWWSNLFMDRQSTPVITEHVRIFIDPDGTMVLTPDNVDSLVFKEF